jgi:hypothetical protein
MISSVRPRLTAILAIVPVVMLAACSTATPSAESLTSTSSPSAAISSTSTSTTKPSATPLTTPSPTVESLTTTETTPPPAGTTEPDSSVSASTGNGSLPTDLSGAVYGFVKAVDVSGDQLTVDKVDWFTGAAAEQACAEDNVPAEAHLNGWCSMYYFRNVNPALRVVSVSPSVTVTTLDGNVPVPGDLASLAARIQTPTGSGRPYQLTVTNGAVVEVTEIYQP